MQHESDAERFRGLETERANCPRCRELNAQAPPDFAALGRHLKEAHPDLVAQDEVMIDRLADGRPWEG